MNVITFISVGPQFCWHYFKEDHCWLCYNGKSNIYQKYIEVPTVIALWKLMNTR